MTFKNNKKKVKNQTNKKNIFESKIEFQFPFNEIENEEGKTEAFFQVCVRVCFVCGLFFCLSV